jgi:photosystem II stability/assembly factor-like uncharacterized protein
MKTLEKSTAVFLATTGTGLARAVRDDRNGWSVETLLPGQRVHVLAADASDSQRVYAGTDSGVLASRDSGRTWRPAGLAGKMIRSLASSGIEPGTVYAGTKPAHLFVSRDSGETWAELAGFRDITSRWFWFSPAEWPPTAYVQGLALSPTDRNVIIAGIEAGAVVRSEDGGQTWADHRPGALRDCHTLSFHSSHGDWAYEAGGTGGGVAFSQDGGRTWQQPKEGLDRRYGWACAADPARPDMWYASVSTGPARAHGDGDARAHIYRSAGGAPWERLSGGLPQPLNHMPYALLTHPSLPGELYAGLSNGEVWHSSDYGDSWAQLPFSLGRIERSMIMLLPVDEARGHMTE